MTEREVTIDTLIEDIERVLLEPEFGATTQEGHQIGPDLVALLGARLDGTNDPNETPSRGSLRASNVGTPCPRKLWYKVNTPQDAEGLEANAKFKFLYGDVIELIALELARKAGHRVEGQQDEVELLGVKGHRDAVIDGMVVDVKSCSSYSFKKFKEGLNPETDAFGYLGQLQFYLVAAQFDDTVKIKDKAAFLAIDKVTGGMHLDVHTFGMERVIPAFVNHLENTIKMVDNANSIPERAFEDVPFGKSGNRSLCVQCSYCEFKNKCWPEMRTFLYSDGPKFMTKVVREPQTFEKKQYDF